MTPTARRAALGDRDGALRTLGFGGDFAKLHKLTRARLGFADTVHV